MLSAASLRPRHVVLRSANVFLKKKISKHWKFQPSQHAKAFAYFACFRSNFCCKTIRQRERNKTSGYVYKKMGRHSKIMNMTLKVISHVTPCSQCRWTLTSITLHRCDSWLPKLTFWPIKRCHLKLMIIKANKIIQQLGLPIRHKLIPEFRDDSGMPLVFKNTSS